MCVLFCVCVIVLIHCCVYCCLGISHPEVFHVYRIQKSQHWFLFWNNRARRTEQRNHNNIEMLNTNGSCNTHTHTQTHTNTHTHTQTHTHTNTHTNTQTQTHTQTHTHTHTHTTHKHTHTHTHMHTHNTQTYLHGVLDKHVSHYDPKMIVYMCRVLCSVFHVGLAVLSLFNVFICVVHRTNTNIGSQALRQPQPVSMMNTITPITRNCKHNNVEPQMQRNNGCNRLNQ